VSPLHEDIAEGLEHDGPDAISLRSPSDLYVRWERQHWQVEAVDVGRDHVAWMHLRPFVRDELRSGIAELHSGEVCVTETLTPLIDFAPTSAQRLYLATQIADEARHVRFFSDYSARVTDADRAGPAVGDEPQGPYMDRFDPALRRATLAVRERPDDPGAWYEACVYYHFITEGVLASTVLRSMLALLRNIGTLCALLEGLVNVARDESRHISFGLGAVRDGVAAGHAERIEAACLEAIALAAHVLVGPERRQPAPIFPAALKLRAHQLAGQWDFARTRMRRNLRVADLVSFDSAACAAWDGACSHALDAYATTWGEEHPVRRTASNPISDGARA